MKMLKELVKRVLHLKAMNPIRMNLCGRSGDNTTDPNLCTCKLCLDIARNKKRFRRDKVKVGKKNPEISEATYKRVLNDIQ